MKRIGLIGENSVEYIAHLLEIWNQGATAVLVDWRIPFASRCALLRLAGVERCYLERAFFPSDADQCPSDITFLHYDASRTAQKLPPELLAQYQPNQSEEDAVVLFSSGTTGKAKGIRLSHRAITNNANAIQGYADLHREDVVYVVRPLSHASALVGELLLGLICGCSVVAAPTILPARKALDICGEFGVTFLTLNPTLLRLWVEELRYSGRQLPQVRLIYCSGSVAPIELLDAARQAFGKQTDIFNSYGLSEAGPRVTAQTAQAHAPGSLGTAIPGVEIVIVNADGSLQPPNQPGEIHVKTPSCFSGYINGKIRLPSRYQGWLNTGDIGKINETGELFFLGRSDDMIVRGAHNLYPAEIEKVIYHVDGISECVVVGFSEVDGDEETVFCAYSGEKPLSERWLRKCCGKSLAGYEIPDHFLFMPELPKTANGKISRLLTKQKIKEKKQWEPNRG